MEIAWENILEKPTAFSICKRPTAWQLILQFLKNINILKARRNWITLYPALGNLMLFSAFIHYLLRANPPTYLIAFGFGILPIYHAVVFEIYIHRYLCHHSFEFRNRIAKFLFKFSAPRDYPDETHVIPHIVHHKYSDSNLDPYNARYGWFNCFMADLVYQRIRPDLTRAEYEAVKNVLRNEFFYLNTYERYQKWGSIAHPVLHILESLLSNAIFAALFYWIGGFDFVVATLAGKFLVSLHFKNVNYVLHGFGKPARDGNYVRNSLIYGPFANWHKNHHHDPIKAITSNRVWQINIMDIFLRVLELLQIVRLRHKESAQ